MKQMYVGLIALLLCLSSNSANDMSIALQKSQSSYGTQETYQLACSGAIGNVEYDVEGLPNGAQLIDNTIVLSTSVESGSYLLRIKATDENDRIAQKIVSLVVQDVDVSSSNSASSSTSSSSSNLSSSQGSSSLSSSSRLNQIISQYSTITDITKTITYQGDSYPVPNLPSGGNSDALNLDIATINNFQAVTSSANRNQVTSSDVALRAASERHQNAIKAITNLLTIIDQARANQLQAEQNIQYYNQKYIEAQRNQKNSQERIVSINIRIQQITSAIKGISKRIGEIDQGIGALTNQRNVLMSEINDLGSQIAVQIERRTNLQNQVQRINGQLQQYRKKLSQTYARCQALKAEISAREKQLSVLQRKIDQLKIQITNAEKLVEQKRALVQILEEQLAQAKNQYNQAKNTYISLTEQQKSYTSQKNTLMTNIEQLKVQYSQCQQEYDQIAVMIQKLGVSTLEAEINQITIIIQRYEYSRNTKQTRVGEIDILIPNLNKQKDQQNEDLTYIQNQLISVQADLRQAHRNGNQINTQVIQARQSLTAAIERRSREAKIQSEATMNLEKARAEEALARLALQEVIAYYSNGLPYSIVPNGNGQTNAGTPAGNNPSGSPLGPVQTNGSGASGSFSVNWTHYLSQAYGAGVNPAYSGSVTTLYPFSFNSQVSGNTVINSNIRSYSTSQCSGGQVRSMTGTISNVNNDSFTLTLDDGSNMVVNVAPCTQMNANVPDYEMKTGAVAIVKGATKDKNVVTGQSVTCLA